MANKKESTVQVAQRLVEPVLQQLGLILWDVRFEKEGGAWYLRYFVDKEEGGVNIGELEQVNKAVDKLLDEEDPIPQSYTLEVSSPGIERQLTKSWHYEYCAGCPVSVRLYKAVEGRREFVGILQEKVGDTITILLEEQDVEMSFLQSEAAYVRIYDDFETGGQDE